MDRTTTSQTLCAWGVRSDFCRKFTTTRRTATTCTIACDDWRISGRVGAAGLQQRGTAPGVPAPQLKGKTPASHGRGTSTKRHLMQGGGANDKNSRSISKRLTVRNSVERAENQITERRGVGTQARGKGEGLKNILHHSKGIST